MRETVGAGVGVKASGGIRTLQDLRTMVAAGATRIGAERRRENHLRISRRVGAAPPPRSNAAGSKDSY